MRTVITLTLIMATLAFGLSACNTARGVGEDFKAAGDGINRAVNDDDHKKR